MSLLESIRNKIEEQGYPYSKPLYAVFYFVSGVYTGVLSKNTEAFYLKEKTSLPQEDTFLSGYLFNEDIQFDLENGDGLDIYVIDSKKLEGLDPIEENMFLLSDDHSYEIKENHVVLRQGNKVTIVPKRFEEDEIKNGLTLRVVNYLDYDKNDIPFVRYTRLVGFYPYEEGRKS